MDPLRGWLREQWRGDEISDEDAAARGGGTAGNERLTGLTGVVLLLLFVAEGVTILLLGSLLAEHVFIGMLLIPPVALKLASTGYRFGRYYTGSRRYRRRGPPPLALRLLAPVVILSTMAVLSTGVALVALGHGHDSLLTAHQVSFIIWIATTGVHSLAYVVRATRLAGAELVRGRRPQLPGGGARRVFLVASLAAGVGLAIATLPLGRSWSRERGQHRRREEALIVEFGGSAGQLWASPSPSQAVLSGPRRRSFVR
jgi:hypothetical protein